MWRFSKSSLPLYGRPLMIASPRALPMPGSASSSSAEALLISTSVDDGLAAGAVTAGEGLVGVVCVVCADAGNASSAASAPMIPIWLMGMKMASFTVPLRFIGAEDRRGPVIFLCADGYSFRIRSIFAHRRQRGITQYLPG